MVRHWSEDNGVAGGWNSTVPGALVATVSPKPCGLGFAGAPLTKTGRQHRDRGVIGKDRQHMPPDGVRQRRQQGGGFTHPVGQRRAIQIKAVALEDLALAIQRQVVGIFVDQNMGEQARTGTPAFDRARRQRGLGEAIATRAGHPGPHDAVHDEAAGQVFQLLGPFVGKTVPRTVF